MQLLNQNFCDYLSILIVKFGCRDSLAIHIVLLFLTINPRSSSSFQEARGWVIPELENYWLKTDQQTVRQTNHRLDIPSNGRTHPVIEMC